MSTLFQARAKLSWSAAAAFVPDAIEMEGQKEREYHACSRSQKKVTHADMPVAMQADHTF